ncbi:hypothetical protein Hrd1104_11190 [Halorhabdus sp. CBA1104]|uniref:VNG_1110C family protein n=1 Tax=unclassified Halorhabdus TaxID=2621901 RepID=UPI0012B3F863|nr:MULTISPECIES: hypothetical protein [unclassified Halorhabdus]QGN07810.1 hypothetical protein Hrd1104_11190 [Halorhabdus sp. CBA1104]
MSTAARFRDSTQIQLPADALETVGPALTDRFTVTVRHEDAGVRIIGSPVEIKRASDFLARNGIAVE